MKNPLLVFQTGSKNIKFKYISRKLAKKKNKYVLFRLQSLLFIKKIQEVKKKMTEKQSKTKTKTFMLQSLCS